MKVVLIGTGNLAHHLGELFLESGIVIVQIIGRSVSSARKLGKLLGCPATDDYSKIDKSADAYLILVADHDIAEALKDLDLKEKVVAHASGTASMSIFPKKYIHAGVFWPLQTFTKGLEITNSSFPICIESRSSLAKNRLSRLAKMIGCRPIMVEEKERELLHLAAVLVNNLPNHLYASAERILSKKKIPFGLLQPLISETSEKLKYGSPAEMQTGPARRGDTGTIKRHLELLENDSRLQKIYKLVSDRIADSHGPVL
ncbi:MAG: Rossmann-like and DUF2520 domain-containing protein [Bacteroidota bacterium]